MAGLTNMPDLRTRLTLDTSQFSAGLTEARGQASMFGASVGMIGAAFATAATSVATFGNIALVTVGAVITAIAGIAAAVMTLGVVSAAQSEQVKTAWNLTAQFIERGMLMAANAYIPVLTQLAQNVETAFSQVQGSLTQVFDQLAPVFGNLANEFLNRFVGIVNELPTMVSQAVAILTQIEPTFDAFLDVVKGGFETLKDSVLQFGAGVLQGALPVLGQFFAAIMNVLGTIVQVISSVGPALAEFGNTVKLIGQGVATLLSGLGPPFALIIGDLNQIGPILAQALTGLEPTLAGLLTDVAGLGQALMPLFSAIGSLLPNLGPVLVALGNLIVQMAGGFIKGIQPILTAMSNPAWSAGMLQGIQQLTGPLTQLATVFGQFITFVIQGFGLIIQALGTVFSAFSSLVPGLSGIGTAGGTALMVGIIAGLAFMVDPLLGIVVGIVGMIAAFMPHSPADQGPLSGGGSPQARGQALVRDFASGMTSNTGLVKTAANNIAAAATTGISSATTSPLGGAAAAGAGGGLLSTFLTNLGLGVQTGGNVVVNVAGSVLSQNELLDTIQTASLRKQNRNAGSVLATSVRSNA